MADRTITTDLIGRDRMSPAFDRAGKSAKKNADLMGKAGGVMKKGLLGGAVAGAAGLAVVGKFLVQGVKDAASYQKVLAKTAQVLKTTGHASGQTVKGIKDQAAALESLSGVDEELIINSQNVLATFTQIKNVGKDKIFDRATKSALDLSVAMNGDLQGASIQVGKALNDPVKGVTALTKVGVSFTQKQKDVIAAMVKTGNTAGAQKVILKELNKEFGGQAKAAGKGFEGTMARLQDAVGDTGRDIGALLLPKLTEAAKWLGEKIPVAVQDFKNGWKGIGKSTEIGDLAVSLRGLSDQLANLTTQAEGAKGNGFISFAHKSISALTTLSQSFEMLGINWRLITATISKWNDTVAINFQKMITNIAEAGSKLPGPMGKHFQRIAADGKARISELQGSLDKTNTKIAQARLEKLELNLRILGRQKATPKVDANIIAARAKLGQIAARLRGIKDKYVSVFISEINRDRATAGRGPDGARAAGGPVTAGKTYWVGEKGPELFTAQTSGRIIANGKTPNGIDKSRAMATAARLAGLAVGKAYGEGLSKAARAHAAKTEGQLLRTTERLATRLKNRIDKAMQQLADRIKAKADFVASVKASIVESGNITQGTDSGGNEAVDIVANLRAKVAQAKAFAANIQKLRKMGLSKTSMQQIIDAGPEAGGQTAAALAAGGKGAIDEVNKLQSQLGGIGKQIGTRLGGDWYNAGIQASKGLLKGLKSERKSLMKFARSIGHDFAKEIKKALGIKSPSQVMHQIGVQTMQGWANGVSRGGADVGRAVTAVTSSIRPPRAGIEYRGRSSRGEGVVYEVHVHVNHPLGTPTQVADAVVTAFEKRPAGAKRIPARAVAS